jgi:NitT/TauT family transport system permease protein
MEQNSSISRRRTIISTATALTIRIVLYLFAYALVSQSLDRPAFPPLEEIGHALAYDVLRGFSEHLPPTLWRWLVVYCLGTFAGVFFGILLGYWRSVHRHARVDVDFFRSLPATILIIFIMAAFGDGSIQRSLPTLYITFFTVVFYVSKHVAILDRRRIEHLRELGAGPLFVVSHCVFYEVLPAVLVAARQAVSLSFLVAISVELIVGPYGDLGLGRLFYDWQFYSKYACIIGGLLIVGCVGYVLNVAMLKLHQFMIRWNVTDAQVL